MKPVLVLQDDAAAGTVLDAAALTAARVPVGSPGPRGVCIRSLYIALRDRSAIDHIRLRVGRFGRRRSALG